MRHLFVVYFCITRELWGLDAKLSHKVDVFQRTFLRKIINVTKLDKVSNVNLYKICKTQPWSKIIQVRRMRFVGHMLRLDSSTPVRQALVEYLRPVRRDRGRPPVTWWSIVVRDLRALGLPTKFTNILEIAENRDTWRKVVRRAMSEET